MLIFILGGIRSGKSKYASKIAEKISTNKNKEVVYIATYKNDGRDKEMGERIERHKKSRPKEWKVIEEERIDEITLKIRKIKDSVVIIDCLTLLVSNFFAENEDADEDSITLKIEGMIKEIEEGIKNGNKFIIISNEVGEGIIPANKISRRYGDLLGRANQIIAEHSDEFYFMFAGIPMKIK